jgi:hypothetical protein
VERFAFLVSRRDRAPEKRKVGGSTPPLTTASQASASPLTCRNRRKRAHVMPKITPLAEVSDQRKRWPAESCAAAGSREERQTMNAVDSRARRRKPLAAGMFQPEISSFRLALAAEGKAAKTVRNYTEAVQWFATAHLIPQTFCTRWEQVSGQDIQ